MADLLGMVSGCQLSQQSSLQNVLALVITLHSWLWTANALPHRLPRHLNMMTMYGYNAQLQANWTNLGVSRSIDDLSAGFATTGLPGLFRLDDGPLFNLTVPHHMKLADGWPEVWRQLYARARPLLLNGTLRGCFIGDEVRSLNTISINCQASH